MRLPDEGRLDVSAGTAARLGVREQPRRLVDKVLNNALEHSRSALPVEVELRADGNQAILEVQNYGDPLPNVREEIFLPFVSNKERPSSENLGLGLSVARVITNHHGGTIPCRLVTLLAIDG